ncbi:MAG: hypothetical protein ACLFU8_18205 [Anaerolineales bacterium]
MKGRLLLLGVGLIGLALLIVLGLSWLQPRPTTGVRGGDLPAPLARLPEAQEAYATLEKWMSSWAEDAGVVNAGLAVRPHTDDDSGWSFQVYSPGRKRLVTVLVTGREVRELQQRNTPYRQQTLQGDDWRVTSSTVLREWWQARGAELWKEAQASTLHLHLGRRRSGAVTWQVIVQDAEGRLSDFWEVDAQTGAVVDVPQE